MFLVSNIFFNLPKDMASHNVLERAEWFTPRSYYKLAVLKFKHKAYNGRLPITLSNCIAKKRNLSNSIRARDSLLVPHFNTRFTTLLHSEVLCFGTCWLTNIMILLIQTIIILPKNSKLQNFLRLLNSMYYQPQLLILNLKILWIFECEFICFLVPLIAFQYAFTLYLIVFNI